MFTPHHTTPHHQPTNRITNERWVELGGVGQLTNPHNSPIWCIWWSFLLPFLFTLFLWFGAHAHAHSLTQIKKKWRLLSITHFHSCSHHIVLLSYCLAIIIIPLSTLCSSVPLFLCPLIHWRRHNCRAQICCGEQNSVTALSRTWTYPFVMTSSPPSSPCHAPVDCARVILFHPCPSPVCP